MSAGDIAAVGGLKFTFTGDTLCAPDHPVVLESIRFPEPVIYVAIEPRTAADEEKLLNALGALGDEDPTFKHRIDENTGQTIISGMGELHLEILVDRLRREFNIWTKVGRPQVAYRETIQHRATGEADFSMARGSRNLFARVVIEIEPTPKGEPFKFMNGLAPDALPKACAVAIEASVRDSLAGGVLAGYPIVDLRARLLEVAFDEENPDEGVFYSAASIAFTRAMQEARPVLLEPVMKIEVNTPEENTGDVLGDLNARRGVIEGMEPRPGGMQAIRGHVALAEMFGYATDLRSATQGRGAFTMEFDYYDPVPPEVSARILGEPYH